MIASLNGTLIEKQPGACVVECGGVGYLVSVSSHSLSGLPERGATVFLRTRQVVREDALLLFGFVEAEELELFDLMIGVSGVGPKLALAVLSGMKPASLARAIRDEQIAALVAISGVGRKTAERLIVELRDKIELPASPAPPEKTPGVLPKSGRFDDAVAALLRLGYTAAQAQEVVRAVSGTPDELSLEDLVRRALAQLTKPAPTR